MGYVQNAWYMVAWAGELPAIGVLARTVLEQPLVLYRGPEGQVVCFLDRCPHRFAPLSMGRIEGATLRCAYHGLRFGADGGCVENPHGPATSVFAVRSFAALERHKIVWVWMGARELADPELIPDMTFMEKSPASGLITGYLPTQASHLLLVDNILDLTHADYLHPESLGGGSITRSTATIESRPNHCLFVQWVARDEVPLPIMRGNYPDPDMRLDMWTEVLWHPSGVMLLTVGGTPAGWPREVGMESVGAHIMTPESGRSTHYFFCNTRNYQVEDESVTREIEKGLRFAFEHQDKPIIEAQQRRIGDSDLLSLRPALQRPDIASTRARRILEQLIAEEEGMAATQAHERRRAQPPAT